MEYKSRVWVMIIWAFIAVVAFSTTNCRGESLLEFIKLKEGFVSTPYSDGGSTAVGYGCNLAWARKNGFRGSVMTQQQAEQLLTKRLNEDRMKLSSILPGFDRFPNAVRIAIQSSYYNCPATIGPRVQRFCRERNWEKLSRELAYNYDPGNIIGLVNRHVSEANLIRKELGLSLLVTPTTITQHKQVKRQWLSQG